MNDNYDSICVSLHQMYAFSRQIHQVSVRNMHGLMDETAD